MSKSTRRQFLTAAALGGASPLLPGRVVAESVKGDLPAVVHMVYFWLKDPGSTADREALIAGLKTLAEVPFVKALHIGVPASAEQRDVVDNSFQVAELMLFDDAEAQNAYQAHSMHIKFVEEHSHLWERVVVRDSIAV